MVSMSRELVDRFLYSAIVSGLERNELEELLLLTVGRITCQDFRAPTRFCRAPSTGSERFYDLIHPQFSGTLCRGTTLWFQREQLYVYPRCSWPLTTSHSSVSEMLLA